jgi:hypothetical protein
MRTLFCTWWNEFWKSEEKARLWLRSALGGVAMMVAQIDFDNIPSNTAEWLRKLIPAGMAVLALGTKAGEKNRPEEKKE